MRPIQSTPGPVVVKIVTGDVPWWEVASALGPFAILLAAFIAAFYTRKNLLHRRESEQRSEWWTRAQWALDSAIADDPARQQQGLVLLDLLAKSELARPEEVAIIEAAWQAILGGDVVDGAGDLRDNGSTVSPQEEGRDEHGKHP